jgi:hypothetical protein
MAPRTRTAVLAASLLGAALGCSDDSSAAKSAAVAAPSVSSRTSEATQALPKVQLAMRLETGDVYFLETDTDQVVEEERGQQVLTLAHRFLLRTKHRVESVDREGNARVNSEFVRVRVRQSAIPGALELEYDSDAASAAGGPTRSATPFAVLVGRQYVVHLARDGAIRQIEGAEALVEEIAGAIPESYGELRDVYRDMVRQQFGAESLKDMEQRAMPIFPARELAPGDAWENEVVVKRGYPMVLLNTYRLLRCDGGSAFVELTGDALPLDGAEPVTNFPFKTYIELQGRQEGSFEIDERSGLVVVATLRNDLTGKRRQEGPEPGQKAEFAITIRGTTRIKVER